MVDSLSGFDRQRIKDLHALIRDDLDVLYEINRKQAVETRPLERRQLQLQAEQVRESYNRHHAEYAALLRTEIPTRSARKTKRANRPNKADGPEAKYAYDVCLSFAGEDRLYAQQVADALSAQGIKVFYDTYETAKLWGKDLYVHLDDVYQRKSRYCVMFISTHYAAKLWTNHERRSVQARAFSQNQEYILPARFDDTEIPGLPSTIGYVDLRTTSPQTLAALVIEKLSMQPEERIPLDIVQDRIEAQPSAIPPSATQFQQKALALYNQGLDFQIIGNLDGAIQKYHAAIELDDDLAEAYYNLGIACKKKDDLEGAIAAYRLAIVRKPDYADAYNNLGVALEEKGDLSGAIEAYQEALAIDPKRADAQKNLGIAMARIDDPKGGIRKLRRLLKSNPKDARARYNLAVALAKTGDMQGAIREYRRAIRDNPADAKARNNLGLALAEQGKTDEAIAEYRRAIALHPRDAYAHYNLGIAYKDKGQFADAAAEYRRSLEINPSNPEVLNNLGAVLMEMGALDDATATLYQALYLNPQLASAHNNLGLVRAKRGDLEGALEEWGKAIASNPALDSAHYNMARIYALQGDRVSFLRSLKTAIELSGSNREAAKTDAAFNHIRDEPEYRELIEAWS